MGVAAMVTALLALLGAAALALAVYVGLLIVACVVIAHDLETTGRVW